jgi:hypothetical protein
VHYGSVVCARFYDWRSATHTCEITAICWMIVDFCDAGCSELVRPVPGKAPMGKLARADLRFKLWRD